MFTILGNGSIQTDSINDALALAARMRTPQGPPPVAPPDTPEPPPTKHAAKVAAKKNPAVAERPRGKRTGTVYRSGKSWKFDTGPGSRPNRMQKGGFETREAAVAALAKHWRGSNPGGFAPGVNTHAVRVEPPVIVGVSPAPESILPSNPEYIHPGDGWGPIDDAGIAKHLRCNGTGKVADHGKLRGKTRCYQCDGQGFRRCTKRVAMKNPSLAAQLASGT